MDDNPDEPISEEEKAKLLAEPTADTDTQAVKITTKDGGEIHIDSFLSDPIVGTIGNIATGLLGQKGASDRNEQQIAMTREQMAWQERK